MKGQSRHSSLPDRLATIGLLVMAVVLGLLASVARDARYAELSIAKSFWFFAFGAIVCGGYGFNRALADRPASWTLACIALMVLPWVFWPAPSIDLERNNPPEARRLRSTPAYVFGPVAVGGALGVAMVAIGRFARRGGAREIRDRQDVALTDAQVLALRSRVLALDLPDSVRSQLEHSDTAKSEAWQELRQRFRDNPEWTPRSVSELWS